MNYPKLDKSGRDGLYCVKCGTIFYVPHKKFKKLWLSPCPVCNGAVYLITDSNQPVGKGFLR